MAKNQQLIRGNASLYSPSRCGGGSASPRSSRQDQIPEHKKQNNSSVSCRPAHVIKKKSLRRCTPHPDEDPKKARTRQQNKAQSLKGSRNHTIFPQSNTPKQEAKTETFLPNSGTENKDQKALRLTKRGGGAHGPPRLLLRSCSRRP